MKKLTAWHFLQEDKKLRFEPFTDVKVGETLTHEGELKMCSSGLHASIDALDALQYAPGLIACRVELSGDIIQGDGKCVASQRKVKWMADATVVVKKFAIWCAEEALANEVANGRTPDPRSYAAIQAAKDYLEGKIDHAAAYAAAKAAANAADKAAFIKKANKKLTKMLMELAPNG